MNRNFLLTLLLLCNSLFTFYINAQTQELYKFNYSIENGLSSNHIYEMTTDKLGYIWLCTPAGIARYNGYEFKIFNVSDGLPTDDIWKIAEDGRGKIWLAQISDEIGYIHNNKYHSADISNYNQTIYPRGMQGCANGVVFTTINFKDKALMMGFEQGNKIHFQAVDSINFPDNSKKEEKIICRPYITNNLFLFLYNNSIYDVTITDNKIKPKLINKLGLNSRSQLLMYDKSALLENCLFFAPSDSVIKYHNVFTGKIDSVITDKEKNVNVFLYYQDKYNKNYIYTWSKKHIYKYFIEGGVLRLSSKRNINQVVTDSSIEGTKITGIFENDFWGTITTTTTDGLNICNNAKKYFDFENNINLKYFKHVEGLNCSPSFWWNSNKTLAIIDDNRNVVYKTLKDLVQITCCYPYKKDSVILIADKAYWYVKSKKLVTEAKGISLGNDIRKIIISKEHKIFALGSKEFFSQDFNKPLEQCTSITTEKYTDFVYDYAADNFWVYNVNTVFIYNNRYVKRFNKKQLNNVGINKIEQIIIDSQYSNVFILQNGINGYKLMVYDNKLDSHIELFKNFNLKKSRFLIRNNTLVISGGYGVIFSKILGKQKMSEPVVYRNIKNVNYNEVTGMDALAGKIILNTNKGVYATSIPTDDELKNTSDKTPFKYSIILYYGDTAFKFSGQDTLRIDQKRQNIQFDVINPDGSGKVHYSYLLVADSTWHELDSDELLLPSSLIPGKYYTMSICAKDDIWRSDEKKLCIYINPYWWQLIINNRFFGLGIAIILLSLIMITIFLTRRLVNRKNLQRNLRQEIEIKSVHSQINPHFIFNSLNTALYFIKKQKVDDAYDHVSKFSKLLRAYIKSSRSKYISIADEAVNLNDYIQLQQNRFADEFNYEINIDDALDTARTKIPALLLQPIVENAIDHGLFHKKGNGRLKIDFEKIFSTNEIRCVISDNGIGRKQSKIISMNSIMKSESYGESLIKDLIAIFNKYEKTGISIEYIDKQMPETGTTVIVRIKNPIYEK